MSVRKDRWDLDVRRLTLSVEATYAVTNNSFLWQAWAASTVVTTQGKVSLVISNNRPLHSLIGS
jgi:hypothetical protein